MVSNLHDLIKYGFPAFPAILSWMVKMMVASWPWEPLCKKSNGIVENLTMLTPTLNHTEIANMGNKWVPCSFVPTFSCQKHGLPLQSHDMTWDVSISSAASNLAACPDCLDESDAEAAGGSSRQRQGKIEQPADLLTWHVWCFFCLTCPPGQSVWVLHFKGCSDHLDPGIVAGLGICAILIYNKKMPMPGLWGMWCGSNWLAKLEPMLPVQNGWLNWIAIVLNWHWLTLATWTDWQLTGFPTMFRVVALPMDQ